MKIFVGKDRRLLKVVAISLAALIAMGSVGVIYANVGGGQVNSGQVNNRSVVQTSQCRDPFIWHHSNDDGTVDTELWNGVLTELDPGDDYSIIGQYDYWGVGDTSSSNDPGAYPKPTSPPAPGDAFPRNPGREKDVARTTTELDETNTLMTVTVENAYPYYYSTVFFALACPPPRVGTIEDIVLEGVDETALEVWVTQINVGDTVPSDQEGAVGALHIFVKQTAAQSSTYTFNLSITTMCGELGCDETAYAYDEDLGTCFEDYSKKFPWGWTIGPLEIDVDYEFEIYAAVGSCDPSEGTLVGMLYVSYDGSEVVVDYELYDGYTMDGTHLYVGTEPLPRDKKGKQTVSPGSYGNQHTLDFVTEDSYTVGGFAGEEIWIIAHAVICGLD
jgi:hypothetical protein